MAIRDYSPTDDRVDLRRKSSNRQQRLLAPSATISGSDDDIGGLPSLYSNAHVPSSSRQFTLDPSTITIGAQDINNTPTVDATSAASESPDHGPPVRRLSWTAAELSCSGYMRDSFGPVHILKLMQSQTFVMRLKREYFF